MQSLIQMIVQKKRRKEKKRKIGARKRLTVHQQTQAPDKIFVFLSFFFCHNEFIVQGAV